LRFLIKKSQEFVKVEQLSSDLGSLLQEAGIAKDLLGSDTYYSW
jgi:hypothetical protein